MSINGSVHWIQTWIDGTSASSVKGAQPHGRKDLFVPKTAFNICSSEKFPHASLEILLQKYNQYVYYRSELSLCRTKYQLGFYICHLCYCQTLLSIVFMNMYYFCNAYLV